MTQRFDTVFGNMPDKTIDRCFSLIRPLVTRRLDALDKAEEEFSGKWRTSHLMTSGDWVTPPDLFETREAAFAIADDWLKYLRGLEAKGLNIRVTRPDGLGKCNSLEITNTHIQIPTTEKAG